MLREEKEELLFYLENTIEKFLDLKERDYLIKLVEADLNG